MNTNEHGTTAGRGAEDGAGAAGNGAFVLSFRQVDATHLAVVGGKGANLGALAGIDGVRVPPGFCVTTAAFRRFLAAVPETDALLGRLTGLAANDRDAIRDGSADLRRVLEATPVPDSVVAAITTALERSDADAAYAVRSSATAEDSPTASFAGQHDSFLNVLGPASVVTHVRRAWASLFTERAVAYRLQHGIDHRQVEMGVVVQRMLFPQAAGILFTADPVTSNRRVSTVEAGFGLGEALVSGRLGADVYTVRDGSMLERKIASKTFAVHAVQGGGVEERSMPAADGSEPALTDRQVLELVALGRHVEAMLGSPQDIEWCVADGEPHIVQSRPITTLFPIPATADDELRVYVSVGHQQMMTDAMTPLGISMWQRTAMAPMHEAGGRLFVEVTRALASPVMRDVVIGALGTSDPLIGDALRTVVEREGFLPPAPEVPAGGAPTGVAAAAAPAPIETDRALVTELIARSRRSVAELRERADAASGTALLELVEADLQTMKAVVFAPEAMQVITAAADAATWINEHVGAWLGERNVADALTQSVPDNITAEMGLALLDVADAIRPHPAVVAFLEAVQDGDDVLGGLDEIDGGAAARAAIEAFLEVHGMRCVGEIDIARPRWNERPSALVPILLGNVANFAEGAGRARFERGRIEALDRRREVLDRVRALPDGERKAQETERAIDRLRTFSGFREYPKYTIVSRYAIYRQAVLGEAERLVTAGRLQHRDDIFFLTFDEVRDAVRTGTVDAARIADRRLAFARFAALVPPRVLTSEGEVIAGAYRRDDVPEGALTGLAVSAGTVEGRARVITDLAEARLEPGDILVTPFTDPSWTPVFVGAAGLVTEVGGLMTHGAVIAREYGLPGVVGVEHATRLIRDGERIRVHGTAGYVEILAR